ncbi:MAG: ParB/RepB/Spo0J family partition protein [Bacilli bacterium]
MEQTKRRALGRGLEELFNIEDINYNKMEEKIMEKAKEEEIKEIPINKLRVNPYQPRKTFNQESLQELAESIKEHGVIQPIIVKKSIKDYEIVAGERRFRASRLAGKETIPAIVKDFTDEQMMEIAVLENLQRENLNSIEEALAYETLMKNLNLTQEQLSKRVGKSRSYITNILGLLTLPEEVKNLVKQEKITTSHARALSKLEDQEKIIDLANKIINENLNVRQIEETTKEEEFTKKVKQVTKNTNNEYKHIERELSDYLGTKVKLKSKKIEINYENESDLNRILEIINFNK